MKRVVSKKIISKGEGFHLRFVVKSLIKGRTPELANEYPLVSRKKIIKKFWYYSSERGCN